MSRVSSKEKTSFAGFLSLLLLSAVLVLPGRIARGTDGDVWRDATLYRDEWGVPHVYADNPFAMGFVFGYAQAEDHAEFMLLAYRMANGRLAAVLGEDYADSDAFSLKMGHASLAEKAYPYLDPATQSVCEGFSMGVNAWLLDHADTVPPWADGMKPTDILALWHAFLMSMAPFDLPDVYRRPPAMAGSNAWAVSRERSDEGKAVLVINPHQRHDGYFQWYEAHLVLGDMNVYGSTLRGLPVIVQGHNEHLGWALTPNQCDFADVFREEYEAPERNPKAVQPEGDEAVKHQAMLLYYMSHSLPYHVRAADGMETRHVPAYIGDRGPMFEHASLGLHSWFIGGYQDFGGLRQLLEMGASRTLDQFCGALSMQQIPCFHVVYADDQGNIFYLYNAKTGVRIENPPNQTTGDSPPPEYRWDQPQSYGLAALAWSRIFPLNGLPYIFNPPSGYVQACGNPPWTATSPPVLEPAFWPQWLAADRDSYRAKRVRQLLQQGKRTFRDHQSILFDMVVPEAFDLVPALLKSVEVRKELAQVMHPDFWKGIEVLQKWNFVAETSSEGMTFFHLWLSFCRNRSAKEYPSVDVFYTSALQGEPGAQEIMIRSVEDAARTLRNEYGVVEKKWGDVHSIRRGSREEAISGAVSGDPIFVASDYEFDRGKWIANYGYGFAMVVQFGDVPESVSLLPFGVSQVPGTVHFDDQLNLLLARQFKHVHFGREDILRNAEWGLGKNITLMPRGVTGAVTLNSASIIHARLTSVTECPRQIPAGLAPFSLYVQVERKPSGSPVIVDASIHIPAVLCQDAYFPQLRLYRHEPGLGWQPVSAQQMDPVGRLISMRDEALAEWYVVLGPEEGAQKDVNAGIPATPQSSDQRLVGLDALLNAHDTKPTISGRGRLFHLERHDDESTTALPDETLKPERPAQGVFKMERLDGSDAQKSAVSESPLKEIPGFHYGPGVKASGPESGRQGERIFRMEPAEPTKGREEAPSPLPPSEGSVNQPVSEGEDNSNTSTDTRKEKVEKEEAPAAQMPPPPQVKTPPAEQEVSPSVPKERPPLPDVIPQDPGFVFGPADQQVPADGTKPTGKRVFNIERLN